MKPRKIHKASKFLLVKDYIRRNPLAPNSQICKDTYCSQSLVSRARSELRKEGEVGWSPGQRSPEKNEAHRQWKRDHPPSTTPPTETEEVMIRGASELMDLAAREGHLPDEAEVDPKEFLKTLTSFIRDIDLPPPIRMAAMQQYTKIKADLLGRDSIGPGAPLTIEDQLIRLSLLLKAVGMRTAVKAMEVAFPKLKETPNEANEAEVAVGTTETPESPGPINQENESENVRADDMGVRPDGPDEDQQDPDVGESPS